MTAVDDLLGVAVVGITAGVTLKIMDEALNMSSSHSHKMTKSYNPYKGLF